MANDVPLDQIHVRDLRFRCIIGVNDRERYHPREVAVDLTLYADLGPAGRSDRLEDTVDYKNLKDRIVEMGTRSSFFLIEALAQRIADLCLEDQRVRQVRVLVEKTDALTSVRTVGVEITRSRWERPTE